MSKDFLYPSLVTIVSLIMYWGFTLRVGAARGKFNVPAPQTTGHPDFERVMRVQQNTTEQLLIFVPALWIFCSVLSATWGAAVGGVWILGRIVYAVGYAKAANKRGPGFAITALASLGLVLGSLVGIVLLLVRAM